MDTFQVYKDMKSRTDGEIYIGVVGPVRTGKSTFIKRFMDLLVLPNLTDENQKARARDELPQSASGTTIMTTEPKFVPKEAAQIRLSEDLEVKIRLIDCVGYMVNGATGHLENETERQVKTPWFDYEIPFTKAAEIGTRKVIHEHSTLGIVVTADGSFGELKRENYIPAEEKTIRELQGIGKPFIVLLNSEKPYSQETKELAETMAETYKVSVLPVNCEQLKAEDIHGIMRQILFSFPISEVDFYIPKWVEMLPADHAIKQELLGEVRKIMEGLQDIRSATEGIGEPESRYIEKISMEKIEMDTGKVTVRIAFEQKYYYEVLSELTGLEIKGEHELINGIRKLADMKREYAQIKDAFNDVQMKGYGVVSPRKEEIEIDEPALIRQGNKYGVKIHSQAPSVHMIRANIENEIAPIVGTEEQANDLIRYIKDAADTPEGIWGTSIFGKSIEEMVLNGMETKIRMINEESQAKLQDTMKKIVNDSNGGLVCIII